MSKILKKDVDNFALSNVFGCYTSSITSYVTSDMHGVCKECGVASDKAMVCNNEECSAKGQTLDACNCEDGSHSE